MWPLPWPLTSMEKHLFEEKDSWHNPTPCLLMWFMLNHYMPANQCNPWGWCDSSIGKVHLQICQNICQSNKLFLLLFSLQPSPEDHCSYFQQVLYPNNAFHFDYDLSPIILLQRGILFSQPGSQIWTEFIWTASNIREFGFSPVMWLLRFRLQVRLHIDLIDWAEPQV